MVSMHEKSLKVIKGSICGVCLGVLIFVASFFVSAASGGYFYTATGIGVVIASLITLIFSMSIMLMEEVTTKDNKSIKTT